MEVRRDFNVIVGKKLSEKRNELGYSQQKLCNEIGTNLSAYKHYELGQRTVPISLLMKISDYYNVPMEYFYYDGSEKSIKKSILANKYKANVDYRKSVNNIEESDDTSINISHKLKTARNKNKKTQQEMSDLLGIDISTYNKYEKGTRNPNTEMLCKIANIYKITIEELLK